MAPTVGVTSSIRMFLMVKPIGGIVLDPVQNCRKSQQPIHVHVHNKIKFNKLCVYLLRPIAGHKVEGDPLSCEGQDQDHQGHRTKVKLCHLVMGMDLLEQTNLSFP